MNATTFFSEEMFLRLKRDVQAQNLIDPCDSSYGKKVKINGNTYQLRIHASFYNFGNCEYFCSLWYDYNYKGIYDSREIGGGAGGTLHLENYEAFCAGLNERLKRFPDYTAPIQTFEQMSLF